MDELVERLRSGRWLGETTGAKAADRIEAQEAEIHSLRAEIERRKYDGVHTCHDQCQRAACLLRRENEALRAQVEKERAYPIAKRVKRHEENNNA
jgi:hypothetical protein